MKIDILLHIQDNLGDMWFAAEIALHLEAVYRDVEFHFYTDDVFTFERFLTLQWFTLDRYIVSSESSWHHHNHVDTKLFLVLFRTDFDISYIESLSPGIHTLWIDYLTFDREIALLHGHEHMRSSEDHPIIHIVNSPLSWGLLWLNQLQHSLSWYSERQLARKEWCDHFLSQFDIRTSSPIITVFSYDTQKHIWDIRWLGWSVFGFAQVASPQDLGDEQYILPYVSIGQFYSLLALSDVVVVRWEVSLVAALQLWTPFYWDMYKSRGGWNTHEFDAFLLWMKPSFDSFHEEDLFNIYAQSSKTLNKDNYLSNNSIVILMTEGAKKVFLDIAKRAKERSLIETITSFIS